MLLSSLITDKENQEELFIQKSDRSSRDQEEDLTIALTYLYEFKRRLSKLHPSILPIVESMLKDDV